jgi:carbon monoxide dehydrogenase subunit G
MRVEGVDRRIRGAVNAVATMTLLPLDDDRTDLLIHADASILGRLGDFGQSVIRRRADQMIAEFGRNLVREVSESAG